MGWRENGVDIEWRWVLRNEEEGFHQT
jgi:hypothetical protein